MNLLGSEQMELAIRENWYIVKCSGDELIF